MNLSENIIQAVQLLERHQNFLFSHQKPFLKDFGVTDIWKLIKAEFHGAYLNVAYLDTMEREHKMQIPLFDYQNWRAHYER